MLKNCLFTALIIAITAYIALRFPIETIWAMQQLGLFLELIVNLIKDLVEALGLTN